MFGKISDDPLMTKILIPDGPKTPRWLQKLQYTVNPLAYMDAAAQQYGHIFNAPIVGNHPLILLISDPEALQRVFSSDTKQFIGPRNRLIEPIVGEHSIFVLEGARHRRERRLLMPPFHGERMQTYGQLICQLTHKAMDSLPLETPFSARALMQDISLEVILKVVFGIYEGERFKQLKQLIIQLTDSLQSPLVAGALFFTSLQKDLGPRSPWGYVRSLQQQMRELIYAEIRQRRNAPERLGSDILSLLISARDEAGEPMSDAELHDELITLLLAGHETTATAVAWALYWIHRQPSVYETLRLELNNLGDDPDPLTVAQLPYLTAVCHETLRICPVAVLTVPREVKEPVELMGYHLEPGTRVYGCIYLTHQRPDLYPEPKLFKPERFLERQFSPYEFFPFGGGARRCIGEALAQFEMKLVLATILSRYQLSLADQSPERPQRRGVILVPAKGVRMILRKAE